MGLRECAHSYFRSFPRKREPRFFWSSTISEPQEHCGPAVALEAIQKRPQMYWAGGAPSNWQLIAHLVEDAALAQADKIDVRRDGDLCMVASNVDWMDVPGTTVAELFERFVSSRAPNPNQFRAEVLVMAAASAFVTVGRAGELSKNLALADLPTELTEIARVAARAVIWRLA